MTHQKAAYRYYIGGFFASAKAADKIVSKYYPFKIY